MIKHLRNKPGRSTLLICALLAIVSFCSCEEETTSIGSVIATGEVTITVDTLTNQMLNGKAVAIDNFDSRTGNLMIGNIETPMYGNLVCSFVTRLMCAPNLSIPDSLMNLPDFLSRVDSCKLVMGAYRNDIVGDSLAPQKLAVYELTKQLPSDITNQFNPAGYYDPSMPLATRSYTLSEVANTDSVFYHNTYVNLTVDLPKDFGVEIINKYLTEPWIFQWPQTMAENFLKGFYLTSTFGHGCVANIQSLFVAVFYHHLTEVTTEDEDGEKVTTVKHVNHMALPFTVSPEVLSSNNITYTPSETVVNTNTASANGEVVMTTPGGYIAEFEFPAQELVDRYNSQDSHLSTVNDLMLYIPAEAFDEDSSGIGVAETVLMVKKSEYDKFFEENKIPDNLTSFTGVYDSVKQRYYFNSLRAYFIDLLSKETISPEDYTFMLVPIEVGTETSAGYYGGEGSTYVVGCTPYTKKPTMTLLKTNESIITFSFSTQVIK